MRGRGHTSDANGAGEHDEAEADREVHLVARERENNSKPRVRRTNAVRNVESTGNGCRAHLVYLYHIRCECYARAGIDEVTEKPLWRGTGVMVPCSCRYRQREPSRVISDSLAGNGYDLVGSRYQGLIDTVGG